MSAVPAPLLDVEHLSMRFGGLIAVDDLSFAAARGEITAIIGPNGAGKTTVFNCITGFYKPTSGRILLSLRRCCRRRRGGRAHRLRPALAQDGVGPDLPPGAHARFRDRGAGSRRAHLPEHPPVSRHDGAGEPDRRPAQPADGRVRLDGAGPLRRPPLRRGRSPRPRARQILARQGGPHGSCRRSRRRSPLRRPAPARDRARHVHGPRAALPGRAGGRPQPARVGRSHRLSQVHPGRAWHLDPADRARHVRGDGDLPSHRRPGVRAEDLGRPPRPRAQRPQGDRRLPRRRGRRGGGVEAEIAR